MKDLIRRLFGLPLPDIAAVQFGYGHERCEVHYDAMGRPYVWIFGSCLVLTEEMATGRQVIWIRRAPR